MNAILLCFAVLSGGIEVGWERRPEGGMEYIIQLDPQMLETLKSGEAIQSEIHPDAGDIRAYRIFVGNTPVRRDAPPLALPPAKSQGPDLTLSNPIAPDPAAKPLTEQTAGTPLPSATPESAPTATPEPAKPWWAFSAAMLLLFASLAANVYIGWIAWGLRERARRNLSPDLDAKSY